MFQKTFRRLIRISAGYSLNTISGPLLTIILLPVYTKVLTTADYGNVDLLVMLASFLLLFGILGLTSALTSLYHAPEHEHHKDRVASSALWAGICWSAPFTLGVFGAADLLATAILKQQDSSLTRLVAVGLPAAVIYNIQTTILRLRFAVWRSNLLALMYILVFAATNLIFVVAWRWGTSGVISAHTTTTVVMAIASLALAPSALVGRPSLHLMRRLITLGVPMLPASIAIWALAFGDRVFLASSVASSEIGVYAIANKLASMLGILILPFQSTWQPLSLSIQQEDNAPLTYRRILRYYGVGAAGLGLTLALFAREILQLFTAPDFVRASDYVWLLIIVPLTGGVGTIVTVAFYIRQRFGRLGWAIGVAAAINTLLNLLLIPWLGILGAAIATAIGYLISPLLTARTAQKLYPIPYEWYKLLKIMLVYLGFSLLGQFVFVPGPLTGPIASFGLRLLLLVSYLPVLSLWGIFEEAELKLAFQALRKPQLVLQWLRKS